MDDDTVADDAHAAGVDDAGRQEVEGELLSAHHDGVASVRTLRR